MLALSPAWEKCAYFREGRMRDRKKQRELRKAKEEKLEKRDFCGILDPTPYDAVRNIIRQERKAVPA